jgi:hypothetical protein
MSRLGNQALTGAQPTDTFGPLIQRIQELFPGSQITFGHMDSEWVEFHISGVTDQAAIVLMENQHTQLLGNDDWRFQVLCPSDPSVQQRGLWLHHLATAQLRSDYRAGVWFYG